MSAADDVTRMLTLVPWLLERPGASVTEAAEAFGVSDRVVRRDLAHLDFCGLPGLGGGALFDVTLVEDRVVVSMADELRRPLRLTPREALRLVLTVSAVEEALGDELPALRTALDKVRDAAGLSPDTAMALESGRAEVVPALRDALRDGRTIRFDYVGRADDAPRTRRVDPWQLDVTTDGWYLHGHDRDADDHRVFRLDRVLSLEVLDEDIVTPRPDTTLPTPRFEPTGDVLEVEAVLGPWARWLADALDCDEVDDTPDGRRIVFQTDAPTWAARLLLMGGGDVTIVRPDEVRNTVRSLASAALEAYET